MKELSKLILAVVLSLTLVGAAQAQLAAWYAFDGDATDSAGSADATTSGSYVTGNRGQALNIGGSTSNWAQAPVEISPGVVAKTTIGAWVNLTSESPYQSILQQDGDWARKLVIDDRGPSYPNVSYAAFDGFKDDQSLTGVLNSGVSGQTGNWVFMCATYDNNDSLTTLNVNGTVVSNADSFMRIATGIDYLSIGAIQGNWEAVQGAIDDVFVFNGELTAAQVETIRTAADPLAAAQTISATMSKAASDANTTVKMDFQGSGDETAHGIVAGWETWQAVYRSGGSASATDMTDMDGNATTWDFTLHNGIDGDWNNANGDDVSTDYWYCLNPNDASGSPDFTIAGLTAGNTYRLTPISGQGGSPTFIMPDQDGNGFNYFDGDTDGYTKAEEYSGQTRSIDAVASASGEIVGEFYFNGWWEGQLAGMIIEDITSIPAPAALPVGLALLGLIGLRRRS